MGHNIPVFYAPIDKNDLPEEMVHNQALDDWLNKVWDSMEEYGVRTCTSRNWWIQWSLETIYKKLNIEGLEFTQDVIVILNQEKIQNSIQAIDIFLDTCKNGIPISDIRYDDMIGFLLYEKRNQKISKTQAHKAYLEAKIDPKIKAWSANGYDALVFLFSFLKTLRATMQDCLEQDKYFLYFQPQP